MMHRDLHDYLEGERPAEDLGPADRRRAEAWDTFLGAAREPDRLPPWLEGHVMRALAERQAESAWQRAWRRVAGTRSVTLPLRPVLALAAVLVVAIATLVVRRADAPPAESLAGAAPVAVDGTVMVQFTFEAPDARSVAIAGSFNGWTPTATPLRDVDGNGVWTVVIPMAPGVHQYMFVVDDVEWVPDPRADRVVDDGFGRHNAVVTVSPAAERAL